jgi:hypothetical protein
MPAKPLVYLLALTAICPAWADTEYCAITMNGARSGYSMAESSPDKFHGQEAKRTKSHWETEVLISGTKMKGTVDSTSWASKDNHPLGEITTFSENGRSMKLNVVFTAKTVEIDVDVSGQKTHKSVPLPDGPVIDDELILLKGQISQVGQKCTYWSFGSSTQSFSQCTLENKGPSSFEKDGKQVSANLAVLSSDGASVKIYWTEKDGIIRREFPMGLVAQAVSRKEALASPSDHTAAPDLIEENALKSDKPIEDGLHLSELKIRITGDDLSSAPSDEEQTITKDGDGWIVDVHPTKAADSVSESISEAGATSQEWTKPSEYLPSDRQELKDLAAEITKDQHDVLTSAFAIMDYVSKSMQPDLGIGVPRDALQILKEKTGKCTDYSILTAGLMRAAGIPARIVSGLVTADGTFYYHAWNEVWDGKRWVGIDSVADDRQLSACHIKLAQGNVLDGFKINYPDPKAVKIQLLEAKHE